MYVVISTTHLPDHDRTFLHGIFQDRAQAQAVATHVENHHDFVLEEGYQLRPDTVVSVYIANIPVGIRVDDFVPTLL